MSLSHLEYVRSRARAELGMVARATCAPSRGIHAELCGRYLALCQTKADPDGDCAGCDLRPTCRALLLLRRLH